MSSCADRAVVSASRTRPSGAVHAFSHRGTNKEQGTKGRKRKEDAAPLPLTNSDTFRGRRGGCLTNDFGLSGLKRSVFSITLFEKFIAGSDVPKPAKLFPGDCA
jgi:hypothetical protein